MADFTDTVKIDGEIYDFDPATKTALIPCGNCGHMNEVELTQEEGGEWVWYTFSCENCGHFNQR